MVSALLEITSLFLTNGTFVGIVHIPEGEYRESSVKKDLIEKA
jgi:hypothetical protein